MDIWLTSAEAAARLNISIPALYKRMQRGHLKAYYVLGRRLRFKASDCVPKIRVRPQTRRRARRG